MTVEAIAAPGVLSLNPSSVGPGGTNINIAIYGAGFQCGVKVSFSNPAVTTSNDSPSTLFNNQCSSGVIQSNVQFFSSSSVFMYVNVPDTTPPGPVTLTFTNPDGSTGTGILTINPAPAISSVTTNPTPAVQGATIVVTLTGTGFQNGATLSGNFTVNSLAVNGAGTQAVAGLSLPGTLFPSSMDLTFTNSNGGSAVKRAAFPVLPAPGSKTPAMTIAEDPQDTSGIPLASYWNGNWSDRGNILPLFPAGTPFPSEIVLKPHPFLFEQGMAGSVYPFIEFQIANQGQWGNPFVTSEVSSVLGSKNFDIAFEAKSGNGLIVYGTVTGLYYRRFLQSGPAANCDALLTKNVLPPCWGPQQSIATGMDFISVFPARVTLLANPDQTKNEILMAYQDNSVCIPDCGNLYIRAWDGNSFTAEQPVSTATRIDTTPFDLAYMQSSKKGMLAWLEVNNGTPKYCIWGGTSCTSPPSLAAQAGPTATTDLYRIQLSPDPSSDQIALGTLQNIRPAFLTTQIWSGTAWPTGSYSLTNLKGVYAVSGQLIPPGSYSDWNDFNLVWKKNIAGSKLFAIYNNNGGGLNYQTWLPGVGWSGDNPVSGIPPGAGGLKPQMISIGFDSDPRSGDIFGVMEGGNALFASIRWDEVTSGWLDFTPLLPESFPPANPFGFSYFKNFPTLDSTTLQITPPPQPGSSVTLTVNGTLIQDGAVISFPGFTPNTSSVSHGANGVDTFRASGAIASNAIPGVYDLTITNPDRTRVVGQNLVSITADPAIPVIFSISPDNRGPGASNQTLRVSGYSLPASFTLSFTLNGTVDPNIAISTPQPLTPVTAGAIQQVAIQVNIQQNAVAGSRGVVIRTGGQSFSFPRNGDPPLFTVNYGPSILSVSPGILVQGSSRTPIMVSGNDFQPGANIVIPDGALSLGWDAPGKTSTALYQNKMTGNSFYIPAPSLTTTSVALTKIFFQTNLADPSKPNGQVAIYDDLTPAGISGNGAPGNLIATVPVHGLISGGMNFFVFPTMINLPVPARYWVLVNVEGFQTLLTYDNNVSACNGDTCVGVVSSQAFGSWPRPRGDVNTWTKFNGKKYGIALTYCWGSPLKCNVPQIGNPIGAISDGPDSNQMTGSRFTTAANAHVNGLSVYINTLDPNNKLGTAAIYSDTNGSPGTLIASSAPQTLYPQSFNTLSFPATNVLPPGTYWLMVNLNGPGTTLTYDDGATVNGVKKNNPFNTWPNPGGTGWTSFPGRRYAIAVTQDLSVTSSNVFSSNLMEAFLSADPSAFLGPRQICVVNPDGGVGCVSLNSSNQPYIQIVAPVPANTAFMAYGTTLATAPAYRGWKGLAPWNAESNNTFDAGGFPLWTVLRAYPHGVLSDSRHDEKILGTIASLDFVIPPSLTLQVWNGSAWSSSMTQPASTTFSRSYDIGYESRSGRAITVYGVSGSAIPQYQVWDGISWSLSQSVNLSANQTGNTVLWVRLEPNPDPASNEIVLAYLSGDVVVDGLGNTTVSSNIALHTMVWNGSVFGNERVFNFPAVNINLCGICTPPIITPLFDIAYEHLSGRALLAWGKPGNSTPGYMIWTGSQWLTQPLNQPFSANSAAADYGTTLLYFKLSGDPNSNRIAMGTGTVNGQYSVQLWNGTGWGNPAIRTYSSPYAPGPYFSLSGEWSSSSVSPPASAVYPFASSNNSQEISHFVSDSALFTFSGTEVNVIGQKDSTLGISNVSLDGKLKGRIDHYSPAPTERMALFSLTNLSNTTHTLKIEPSGLKNPRSSFAGGTQTDSSSSNRMTGTLFTAQNDATVFGLSVFLNSVDPIYPTTFGTCGGTGNAVPEFQVALYSDLGGVPGQLLGQQLLGIGRSPACHPTAGAWNGVPLSAPVSVTAGTPYWILIDIKDSGTTLSYSSIGSLSSSAVSVKLPQPYGSGAGIWPASFASTTAWTFSTGRYYSLNATSDPFTGQIVLGVAPPITVDSFDVENSPDSPFLASTSLLFYDVNSFIPTFFGRKFDLAWEKDTGTLLTVFGSPNSINSCQGLSYATRFRKWDPTSGWSADALVPVTGGDLIPGWIQLSQDAVSSDLFLGVSGQMTSVADFCSPVPSGFNQYYWHNGAWADGEALSSGLSGFTQFGLPNPGNGATAYIESFMTVFNSDYVPPSPVTDLIVTGMTSNSVSLQWTSAGDDGSLGKAASYTIYYSTSSIFNNSTPIHFVPVFLTAPSVTESYAYTITGLTPSTTYYFAITATDKAGNVSPLSTGNPITTTPAGGGTGVRAPFAIKDLTVAGTPFNNNVQLTWTAPMIGSSYTGTGAAYDLRWSSFPITDDITFNAANAVIALDGTGRNGLPPPHLAGTMEIFNFVGLPTGTVYFAIKTCGPVAMDPVTFRCTGNPSNISRINSNVPVSVNNGGVVNTVFPSAISDLAIANISSGSMTLRWTVPSNIGSDALYDLRMSPGGPDSFNFNTAAPVPGIPLPQPGGSVQSFTVTNLPSNNTTGIQYRFAIKTINSAGFSLSNVASGTTLPVFDYIPPSPITDLTVVADGVNNQSVMLSWTATGDDGTIGMATQYDIRYSKTPIDSQSKFKSAVPVKNPPLPAPSGRHEMFSATGLDSNTMYYFAVEAIDKAGNPSPLSTCTNCPGHTALHSGYNLVSVPYRLSGVNDPASLFGNDVSKPVTIYQWSHGAYSVPSLIAEGTGYFLYAPGNNSVLKASDASGNLVLGAIPETAATMTVPLQSGWNMIGSPYLRPIFLQDTCIQQGTNRPVPFAAAVASGWVNPSIYSYNGTNYMAERFQDILPPTDPNYKPPADLSPWNGYWLQLLAGDTGYRLVYPGTPGACP